MTGAGAWALAGLFASAFGAATLLPLQSEAVLVAVLLDGAHGWALPLAVATAGNVLGAMLNAWLGRGLARFRERRWFPVSPAALAMAEARYRRWGWPSLLLSWVPVVGDPLTLVAGVLREPWWRFVLVVGLAKGGRYAVLVAATLGWQAG